MELPTAKSLPYYAIAILISCITGLSGYIVNREMACAAERKEMSAKNDACQGEIKEMYRRQTAYLEKQDSINRANDAEIKKIKRKK